MFSVSKRIKPALSFLLGKIQLKPGLTSWVQTMYKYLSNLEKVKTKLSYDLYYVENRGIFLDMNIVQNNRGSFLEKGSGVNGKTS